jgi:xylulokinase
MVTMSNYLLAHDLGTSGDKATLYDFEGRLCGSKVSEYPTYYPANLCVEQEPEDWWKAVCSSTTDLIAETGVSPGDIAAVSFSGQMMGCLLVDDGGNPLGKSIIWADMRSAKQAAGLEKLIPAKSFYHITGHRISSSYGLEKLLWIKENEPERYKNAYKMFNAKDYIILKLTGLFATEYSDASSTNVLDIVKKRWSQEIVKAAGIDADILPELHASTDIAGRVTIAAARETGLLEGTPVIFGGGDGSCAAVGAGVIKEGEIYNVIGSSSWISGAASQPYYDERMRTFNWVHLDQSLYTPCGTMQAAGYSYNWLRNTIALPEIEQARKEGVSSYKLMDELVRESIPGSHGLLFLPYLLGERSPRWNSEATAAFIGAKITTSRGDIYRSVLEGVGYNLKMILDIINLRFDQKRVTVIGGGAKGSVWIQILADIWNKELVVPQYLEEATSLGATICAGVGIGAFSDFSRIKQFNPVDKVVSPNSANTAIYEKLYKAFNSAYDALLPVYTELSLI